MHRLLVVMLLVACSAPRSLPRNQDAGGGTRGGDLDAGDSAASGGDTSAVPAPDGAETGSAEPRSDANPADAPDASATDTPFTFPEAGADIPVSPQPDTMPPGSEAGVTTEAGPALLPIGASCSAGTACASTYCVDGVCCESLCGGQCESCGQAGNKGNCVVVTGSPVGSRAPCAGQGTTCGASCNGANRQSCSYPAAEKECAAASCTANTAYSSSVCDGNGACRPQTTVACGAAGCAGSICAGGCSANNPCPGGQYCSAGKCFPQLALGASCTSAGACSSGKCVDGVCCSSNCDGVCEACNSSGQCAPVKSADDDKCVLGKTCDANGACKSRPGTDCSSGTECSTGNCVDGKCCTSASCGSCQACTGGGGLCVAVTNKDDDACAGTCDASGACKSKQGQPCGAGCVAGTTCSDGYCCDQACTAPCMACNQAGNQGKCMPVASGAPVGGRSCGTGTCAGMCTGAADGSCSYPTANCGTGPTCSAGMFTGQSTCMSGSCVTPPVQSCPMGCDATGCKSTCSMTADCPSPKVCSAGNCVNVVKLSAGFQHTCALLSDGTVRCWGSNEWGQLGDGTKMNRNMPVPVMGLTGATEVAAGADHTCALVAGGQGRCWGRNQNGQLGSMTPGIPQESSTPIGVAFLSGATGLTSNYDGNCVIRSNGNVNCWGVGGFQSAVGEGGIPDTSQVAVGFRHQCLVTTSSAAKCWGGSPNLGNYGELGNGMTEGKDTPVDVIGGTGVVRVSTGFHVSCAVFSSGAVKCWGAGTAGQLGNGMMMDSATPVPVSGVTGAADITSFWMHTCVLLAGGSAACWGPAHLGDGSNGGATPITVPGVSGATAITAGGGHTCVLAGGVTRCWGSNGLGQLGDGTNTIRPTPVNVIGW